MYFIDCLATMFVETLVAFIWHDLWFVQDYSNLFPEDLFFSALASLVRQPLTFNSILWCKTSVTPFRWLFPFQIFGYLLALVCFTLQSYVGILYDKCANQKLLILYIFTTTALLSSLNIWRGLWLFVSYFAGK